MIIGEFYVNNLVSITLGITGTKTVHGVTICNEEDDFGKIEILDKETASGLAENENQRGGF